MIKLLKKKEIKVKKETSENSNKFKIHMDKLNKSIEKLKDVTIKRNKKNYNATN